ncbi:uncharacterized protein LOC142340535 isoform X3 [Convolutriloba macropyga]|uniref:uncharacterized protein LOC142340535 isoform X3 n=1 Tax=Convolutriloba macropyga TaxID=536237 RepID=UPI003F527A2F
MKNMVIRIVLMLALCRGVASLTQRRADIKLENNGYTGILIGVSDDVVPSQKFLDGLERTLADFSDNLFNSTKRRAYLNQITVALPPTWDHFNFSNISSTTEFPTATSKQTIEWANIIVGGQNPSYSDAPYTRQTGECGEPGDYIHLTEKFVTDSAYTTIAFGDVGKLLVREWGHLRWGLFDESGSSDESPTKLFYHGMDGSLHPTRCSAQIEGKPQDAVTGGMCQIGLDTDLPSDTCLFMPDRVQPVGVTGSVMFMHSLPQITEFCDDTADTPDGAKHNAEAPNKQNAMCNGRSAWAVMREHKDFNDGGRERNPSVPAEQARNTRPSIKYVVQRPKEVVFVIDVSTRENVDKVDELRQAVGNYIMNQVQLGTRVGVVTFATTASIVAPLTQVMNETSRGWLVSQLYNDSLALSSTKVGARGATSIGSGLAAAINLISQTGDGTTLDCAEGKENCDQDATALIEEACSYYEQWGKLSNEHVIQYIKMFPERSFTDLETTCKNSQLISDSSSGGDGSDIDPTGDGSSSKVVQDACVNYVANKDFTAAQLTSLNKLFPEKSFTQLTQLCSENDGSELISDNSGRISGDGSNSGISDASTSEVVSEACNYYSKFDDFTAEHISALKTVYPEKTLKQFMQLCSDRNGDAQSELISDTSDASGDGSRPSNGDAISSKVFQEACSYYSSNDDFTTQQLVDLKKLFPGSSLNSLIKLCEQESGSQDELISDTDHNGASNPDNKGDGDQFVSDACDYFLIHGEFRGNDITTLLQLNPDLSFNQLPSLCESGGLPDGGSNSEMTFESVCDEYRRTKNIQGQLIEEQLKMSVLEFISQCSTASKRNRRLALQEGSTEQVTFESVCEEYQRTKIFQGQIIEEQLKMSVIDFISQCQAAQKRSKRDLTNNNMEQNCIDWNEYLELNQNNLQDPIVKAVKQNYDAHCKQVKRLAGNEHGRTRRQQSDDCSLLEKRIETVRDMGDTFLEKMLVESYELKCKSNATKRTIRSVSDDCAKLEERIKNARSSGDSFLEKMLSNNYEQQCTTGAGYSTNSLKLLSERVKRETVTCEQLLDQVNKARQEGNTVVIQVFQEKYDAQCTTQIATGLKRVGRSTDKAEPTCEQLEKRLKDAKGMGMDDFYVTLIQKEYDNKCTSQNNNQDGGNDDSGTSCENEQKALDEGIRAGLGQVAIDVLSQTLTKCKLEAASGSSQEQPDSSSTPDCAKKEESLREGQLNNYPANMIKLLQDDLDECLSSSSSDESSGSDASSDCTKERNTLQGGLDNNYPDEVIQALRNNLEQCLEQSSSSVDSKDDSGDDSSSTDCSTERHALQEGMNKKYPANVIKLLREDLDQCLTQTSDSVDQGGDSGNCEKEREAWQESVRSGYAASTIEVLRDSLDKCLASGGSEDNDEVVDPSTSGDCSEQNEALKQGIASGLSQNLIRLLRDDLEECQKNNQGGSSGSGGGSSVVVGGDCSAWEDMFDQAQQSGNEQWIEQSRKSLQQCKDAAQSGGSADGGDAGMAGLSCEDIRQLYISSDANSPVRTMLLQKNPTCLAGIEDLVDTESEGGAVSCTSFATVLASLEANPNSDPQTIEGVRKNYQQCLKDGGIDPGSQGGAVACTSFATVLASLEASSNSDPQIVEGVRQKYEQCLKDGGIDPSSQGGAASCSNFATVLSSLEANPNSDPSAIKTVRDSYEQCLEAGGIDPSSQGEGSMLANCESIANTIRLMRQDTSGGSQGGQDEASLEVIKKLQESYAECIEKGGFEIDPTDDQWGGGDTVEKMCASLSASINDLRQESELDSTQQETLQKLQSTYNSVCSSDNGGDGVEKTCASLSAAISNLKQQSTELDFAKQQDLQNFLASYNSLCSDNRGTGVFGGAVSPSSQIVLIVAEEEKMPPFISNIALPSIEAQDIQISTVYASYVKDDPQIGDMVRKTATALYNMYYTYSSFAEGNFAPGQFNLPMQITGLFGSQLIVQKQVKVEDISTHDVTVVPVDGGSHLRVTFAQDTPMTLDILDENGQPSQITTKKVTSKLPTIYVTAPFFIPARAGKRENVDAEYSFSPSSYEQEQKQLQLSGANSDPDTEKIQPVVTMFEHTQTIRFLIPLHRLGQKAIGKWTIKIAAPGDVSSENPLVGTLLVDLPPAQPLLIEKPKPKQVEDKETTDLENESDSSDDESQGTSDKRKRSSMSMPDNEFVNEDPILDEDVMDTQLGAASNNPTNDDSDSDLDTAVDPATKDDVDLTLWKQERVSTIQDYLATREREGNSRIVRVSGKIVDEKRYNAKIVQAEVTWGDWHAVLGARVEAKFECGEPAGSTTSSGNSGSSGDAASSSGTGTTTENYHTRNVVLLDNGANSDVHAGDGIYSAYFVYSGQKRCSARIVVTSSDIDNGKQDSATTITTTTHLRDLGRVTTVDMAPGVIFTRPAKQTVPSFRRELVLESFESTNKKTSSDVIPPARVIDLAVVETSLKEQRVQITFTRPKDDLDQDRLAKNPNHVLYDIRISSNLSAIYSSFNSCFQLKTEHLLLEREDMDLDGSFESPKQFSLLTVHFTVPEEVWLQSPSKVFAVALRANDTLQSGAVSNVVLVAMRDPPTTFVPVFIAALLLIALVLLSGLIYTVRRAARKSATSQGGKIYIHVPNLNKKRLSGGHSGGTKGGNRRGSGGASGGYGMGGVAGGNGGSHSIDMDMESLPKLTTTSQVCVDSY